MIINKNMKNKNLLLFIVLIFLATALLSAQSGDSIRNKDKLVQNALTNEPYQDNRNSADSTANANSYEPSSLPGDNLNLYAVMKLFRESKTLELFEKNLNDENSAINNLDLNGDGQVDYISVYYNFDGTLHTIVLSVAINENENQDIAAFYVEKDANNQVQIQLVGDEALYGKDYIVEPDPEEGINARQ